MAFDDPNQPSIPTTGAPAFKEQQSDFNTGYNALGKQQQIAGQTPDLWNNIQATNRAQTQQGLDVLKRNAARMVYANRGSLGGGGGLAALQQGDQSLSNAVGSFTTQANTQRAGLAQQGQQAQIGAEGQIAQAAGQKYKMIADQQQRQTLVNQALDSARSVMQRYAGKIYTTQADRQKAVNAIRTEVLNGQSDPAVVAAVNEYTQNLLNGNELTPNTIDL